LSLVRGITCPAIILLLLLNTNMFSQVTIKERVEINPTRSDHVYMGIMPCNSTNSWPLVWWDYGEQWLLGSWPHDDMYEGTDTLWFGDSITVTAPEGMLRILEGAEYVRINPCHMELTTQICEETDLGSNVEIEHSVRLHFDTILPEDEVTVKISITNFLDATMTLNILLRNPQMFLQQYGNDYFKHGEETPIEVYAVNECGYDNFPLYHGLSPTMQELYLEQNMEF